MEDRRSPRVWRENARSPGGVGGEGVDMRMSFEETG